MMMMMMAMMMVPVFYLMEADQGGEELFAQANLEKGLIKQSFQNVNIFGKGSNKTINFEMLCNFV